MQPDESVSRSRRRTVMPRNAGHGHSGSLSGLALGKPTLCKRTWTARDTTGIVV